MALAFNNAKELADAIGCGELYDASVAKKKGMMENVKNQFSSMMNRLSESDKLKFNDKLD